MMCFDLLQYASLLLFGGFRCFVGKLTQIGGAFTYQGKIGFLLGLVGFIINHLTKPLDLLLLGCFIHIEPQQKCVALYTFKAGHDYYLSPFVLTFG